MTTMHRRMALQSIGAGLATGLTALPHATYAQNTLHVVVVGAGFAGVTFIRTLRKLLPAARITLIEPSAELIMCPMSLRVIVGGISIGDISRPYGPVMARAGVRWIQAAADTIDTQKRLVWVGAEKVSYDKLVVCPGVEFDYEQVPGMQSHAAQSLIPHAWRAGPQTLQLRDRIRELRPGGTMGIHVPKGLMRGKPGVYERASLVAHFLKANNPRAKLFLFDSGSEPAYGKEVLPAAWKAQYPNNLEYVPQADLEMVEPGPQSALRFKSQGTHKLGLVNLIPPQRAGVLAQKSGLVDVDSKWCGVDYLTFESKQARDVHVIGDAMAGVSGMPKSGQMANQQAKVCAAAIADMAQGRQPDAQYALINVSYTFVNPVDALVSTSVYRYNAAKKQPEIVPASVSASHQASADNGLYGMSWATNILSDMTGSSQ